MLTDYAKYLENIRNGLIQCGVVFPQIDDMESPDYNSLFHAGEKLSEIMYFYKIMVCSGNIEGMFLPMDKSYRGTVRAEAFSEFEEDILPYLKEQFGDEESTSFSLESICDVDGVVDSVEDEPEVWVNEDVPAEDTLIEVSDLFDDDEDDSSIDMKFEASGRRLWGTGNDEPIKPRERFFRPDRGDQKSTCHRTDPVKSVDRPLEYVSNGMSLFGSVIKKEQSSEDTAEYVAHGVNLFSLKPSEGTPSKISSEEYLSDDQDTWVDEAEEEQDYSESVLDDQDSWVEDSEDDQDVWGDESEDDQDVWVEESDVQDVWEDETEDDQDSWVPDSEDEKSLDSDSVDDQDVWVSEEDSEDNFEDDTSSDAIDWEEEETLPRAITNKKENIPTAQSQKSSRDPNYEPDIVDVVQEAASAALTSAKQFLANLTNPKK